MSDTVKCPYCGAVMILDDYETCAWYVCPKCKAESPYAVPGLHVPGDAITNARALAMLRAEREGQADEAEQG